MLIEGTAKSIPDVNKFVDTMKNAVYYDRNQLEELEPGESVTITRVFSSVILEGVGNRATSNDNDNKSTYQIRAEYDLAIFNNSKDIAVIIPITSSDDLELIKPEDLVGYTFVKDYAGTPQRGEVKDLDKEGKFLVKLVNGGE